MSTPTVSRKSRASRCMFTLVPLLSNDPHTARSAHPVSLVTRTNYSILGKAVRSRSRPLCLLDFQSLSLRSSRVTHFSLRRALFTRLSDVFIGAHTWVAFVFFCKRARVELQGRDRKKQACGIFRWLEDGGVIIVGNVKKWMPLCCGFLVEENRFVVK